MTRYPITIPLLIWSCIGGCGGASSTAGVSTSPTATADASGAQVARGRDVYAGGCAGCHGAEGQGTGRGPALVGDGALPLEPTSPEAARQVRFSTAADVLTWVAANMPPRGAGDLPEDDYAAVVAFALSANHVDLGGRTLSSENAAEWVLHP